MQNARLDEAQAGIKISGRNNNNLRYANDTTVMEESEEELKSLLKVDQNRKPRDKSTSIWSPYLRQRRQGDTMEK